MAPDTSSPKSQDVCGIYGLEIRPFSAPERPGKSEVNYLWKAYEKLGVSKISGPVSPSYSTYNSRLKTFENWTIPDIQSPEKLAEAGFYYTSVQDNVLCFHCGGGLKNWEVDDDPWVEHARWFSRCSFVLLQKGKDFVNEVLSKAEAYSTSEAMKKIKVKYAMKSESEMKSENNLNTKSQEEKTAEEKSSSTTHAASSSASAVDRQNQSETPKTDLREIESCRICYTREREIVFLPCGHFVSCPQCAPSLSTCAVCRKPFEAIVRAYLS